MSPKKTDPINPGSPDTKSASPFRRAVLHGLGIAMPPLLTILLFVWAWTTTESYVLTPLEAGIRYFLVWNLEEIEDSKPADKDFVADPTGKKYLPRYVVSYVDQNISRLGPFEPEPRTANAYWHRYVQLVYLPRSFVVPTFLLLFLILLYFLGRLFAQGMGRFFVRAMESMIGRVPVVSNVYSSVKQVTDFVFSERDIEFNRVVAIEYPRQGIWSLGFVTGQSMADISAAANEPVLSVLMPTSPMPVTGFTISVRKSETVDVDLTIDQAIQFIVSCGVVVPIHQQRQTARLQLNLPETVERRDELPNEDD